MLEIRKFYVFFRKKIKKIDIFKLGKKSNKEAKTGLAFFLIGNSKKKKSIDFYKILLDNGRKYLDSFFVMDF